MTAVDQPTRDLLHFAKTAEFRRHRQMLDEQRARELRVLDELLREDIDLERVA